MRSKLCWCAAGGEMALHTNNRTLLQCKVACSPAHARDGSQRVGARPQVRDGAEELECVALLLKRVRLSVAAADLCESYWCVLEVCVGGGVERRNSSV